MALCVVVWAVSPVIAEAPAESPGDLVTIPPAPIVVESPTLALVGSGVSQAPIAGPALKVAASARATAKGVATLASGEFLTVAEYGPSEVPTVRVWSDMSASGAQAQSEFDMCYDYVDIGGGEYEYTFHVELNDGWKEGMGWGWYIFGDQQSAPSPLTDFVGDPASLPVGPWTAYGTSGGGHNGPTFYYVLDYWIPESRNETLDWKGTSTAALDPPAMLYSTLAGTVGGATPHNFTVAKKCDGGEPIGCMYMQKKNSKAKKGCTKCYKKGDIFPSGQTCQVLKDCVKKIKQKKYDCLDPQAPPKAFCKKLKGNRVFCGEGCTVRLDLHRHLVCLHQSTLAVASGDPPGGECISWTPIYSGTGRVQIHTGPFPGCEAFIEGTAESSKMYDVVIRVVYRDPWGNECQAEDILTVAGVHLKQLTYTGTEFHDVHKDPDGDPYDPVHWLDVNDDGDASDPGEHRFPVAFTRNTNVAFTNVRFRVKPVDLQRDNVPVRGAGPDGDSYEGSGKITGGWLIVSDVMTSTDSLPNTVRFYNTYNVDWEAALDGETYCNAGMSDNRLYVTLDKPTASPFPLYETVVHIACKQADGETDEGKTVAKIWADFTDRDVRRKPIDGFNNPDGVRMGYWRPRPDVCQNLAQMLASPIGNGSCGAWAQLFRECIRSQGIAGAVMSEIQADVVVNPGADGFLVKDWAFGGNIRTGPNGINNSTVGGDDDQWFPPGQGFPYTTCIEPGNNGVLETVPGGDDIQTGDEINTGPDGVCNTVAGGDDDQKIPVGNGEPDRACITAGPNGVLNSVVGGDDVADAGAPGGGHYPYTMDGSAINLPGIAGQDNPEPPEDFFNHFVVKYAGNPRALIYDPSYGGVPYPTELTHEDAAIDGICSTPRAKINDPPQELDYNP